MFGGMNGRAAFGAAGYRAVKTVLKRELRRSCNYGGGEAEGLLHGLAAVVFAGEQSSPLWCTAYNSPPAIPVFRAGYTKNPTQGIPRAGFAFCKDFCGVHGYSNIAVVML